MSSFHELRRRSLLPLAGLGLAAYYAFVFVPLGRRAAALDRPLRAAWTNLAASLDQSNSLAIDFLHVTNQLAETSQALRLLQEGKKSVASRLELGAALRAKINSPFENVDYETARRNQYDALARLAKQQQASFDSNILFGFPLVTTEMNQPELLWAALAFANELLRTALQCKVTAIHSLDVPIALTNAPGAEEGGVLARIPVRVEITGSMGSIAKLLQSLPLRADEIRAAGLPEAPPDKPVLFFDRLQIKKQSPEKTDEVRISLRAIGFVLRENP